MIPRTSDGRVLFAVPWHNRVVVGTTDILRDKPESEPVPLDEEIDFILHTAGLYMNPAPTRADIVSVFAGQRPLAAPKQEGKSTKEISRSHKIIVSDNNLVTITGGKWTSYRRMAEDTINRVISLGMLIINNLFQGSGFPPCARLLTHWIPPKELATKMSIWNTSHSIGASLVAILCGYIMGTLGVNMY